MLALAGGKLKLRKGGLLQLARYTRAAKQMVAAAARMAAREPRGIAEPVAEAPHLPTAPTSHSGFATTSGRGLRYEALPMRLYQKAKRLGIWDPQDIDFTQDSEDWARLDSLERTVILHLTSQFQAGEESVTLDLLPLMMVIAREERP